MSDLAGSRPSGRRGPSPSERRALHAEETDPAVVLGAAVRFLEARPRSVAEVRRRLRLAGYPGVLIDGAIERLLELGFLDDEAFARSWVESRDRARPRGERALRAELGQKGVDREIADAILEERRSPGDDDAESTDPGASSGEARASVDEAAAMRLLRRRAAQLGRVPDPRLRRQRAYALLARNGFDPGVCSSVARRFAAEADPDGDPDADIDELE